MGLRIPTSIYNIKVDEYKTKQKTIYQTFIITYTTYNETNIYNVVYVYACVSANACDVSAYSIVELVSMCIYLRLFVWGSINLNKILLLQAPPSLRIF